MKRQKTSVEWYISKIKEARNFCDDPSMEMDIRHTLEVLIKKGEQAEEMNRKEIAKAFDDGDYNYHYSRKTGNDFEDGQEYFNELYGEGL